LRSVVTNPDKTPSPASGAGSSTEATYWDAATYHRVADPQFQWGKRLLEQLQLRGDETIVDAGCGSGRLTRLLLERVPNGRVIAVDVSPQMAEAARSYLEPIFDGRVEVLCRNLLALQLQQVADLVFSTATFHWISDQATLFDNIARALHRGGRLMAQMGGKGNLDRLLKRGEAILDEPAYRPFFQDWIRPHVFPDIEQMRARLEAADFAEIHLEHFPEPTTFPNAAAFREFISTVNFRLEMQRITDEGLRRQFIDRLVEAAAHDHPPYTLDYWRLNLSGVRVG
jgi:trans-aconitate methyltransferase